MNKRIISIILSFCIVISSLVFPVFADVTEYPNYWIDLLDYGYAIYNGSNFFSLDGNPETIIYSNPGGGELEYCEILLKTDSTTFRVASWVNFLSVADLGNGLFRVWGALGEGTANASEAVIAFRDYDGTFVEILSFKVNKFPAQRYSKSLTGRLHIVGTGYHDFAWPSDSSTGLTNIVDIDNENKPPLSFTSSMEIPDWGTMDYIQLGFSVVATTIDTINVQLGAISVPYSINTVKTNVRSGITTSYIYLLIDVRELMLSTAPLVVSINGTVGASQDGRFYVSHVLGLVEVPEPSVFTHWFTQVGNWFSQQTSALVSPIVTWGQNIVNSVSTWGQNIVNALGGNSNSDQFQQGVFDANDKLSDASDAMNDFTRPAADSVVPDLGDFDSSSVDILSQFFNNQLVSPLVTAGLAVWLIGIIFGV